MPAWLAAELSSQPELPRCGVCDTTFSSMKDLKAHAGAKHRVPDPRAAAARERRGAKREAKGAARAAKAEAKAARKAKKQDEKNRRREAQGLGPAGAGSGGFSGRGRLERACVVGAVC